MADLQNVDYLSMFFPSFVGQYCDWNIEDFVILLNFPTSKVRILDLLRFERVSSLFSASFFFASKLLRMSFAVSLLSRGPLGLRIVPPPLGLRIVPPPLGLGPPLVALLILSPPLAFAIVPPEASACLAILPKGVPLPSAAWLSFYPPPVALLILSPPLAFAIVLPKAACFSYYPSEGRSVWALSFCRLASVLSSRRSLCLFSRRRSVSLLSP